MSGHEQGLECGRRGCGHGLGARLPFALPGTRRHFAPDRSVDVKHSRIEIALDPAVTHIAGTVTHQVAAVAADTRRIHLHAGEMTIEAVNDADGAALPFRHAGDDLHVELPRPLEPGAPFEVAIRYHATPRRGIYFIHPDAGYPDKRHEAWTQGQDEDSRFWFPCFDHPSEKASTELIARVPAGYTAIGNGALVGKAAHGDGTVSWHWKQHIAHSAYLVTLAVGHYEEVVLAEGDVPLTAYVPAGRRADAERSFRRTAEMVALFSEKFGLPYPYEKYAQVVVQDFIFGGMENTSATTLLEIVLYDERAALDYDMDDLVAHELAHQWWGDLLTCRHWSHGWLNEGFATWSELLWREHAKGEDDAAYDRLLMKRRYLEESGSEYRRPIVDVRFREPIDLFDRHLYEKGGLVLHMLRRELGEDAFWRAVHTYAAEHRGRTVVTEDLRRSIERATGRDLEWFFDQWVFRAGHPELKVKWSYDGEAHVLTVRVEQTQDGGDEVPEIFRMTTRVRVCHEGGEVTTHTLRLDERERSFALPCAAAPQQVDVDPDGDLLATFEIDQEDDARRRTLASDAPLMARIRAAKGLTKAPSADNVQALVAALDAPFWALGAEAAAALGALRHPAARDALVEALAGHEHPRVRKAVAAALGAYRHDARAAAALADLLERGDPSIFVEAAAAKALGETRAPGAADLLARVLAERDAWAEVIRIGAVQGLLGLADETALPALLARCRYGEDARLRSAALRAIGQLGRRLTRREAILDTLGEGVAESDLRIVMAAIAGLRALADARGIALVQGAPARHPDGRVRRSAEVAALRLRKAAEGSDEVTRLGEQVDELGGRVGKLLARIEQLEAGDPAGAG